MLTGHVMAAQPQWNPSFLTVKWTPALGKKVVQNSPQQVHCFPYTAITVGKTKPRRMWSVSDLHPRISAVNLPFSQFTKSNGVLSEGSGLRC